MSVQLFVGTSKQASFEYEDYGLMLTTILVPTKDHLKHKTTEQTEPVEKYQELE